MSFFILDYRMSDRHNQTNMPSGKHQNGSTPITAGTVKCVKVSINENDKFLIFTVQIVGKTAAITFLWQYDMTFDSVTVSLDYNSFLPYVCTGHQVFPLKQTAESSSF